MKKIILAALIALTGGCPVAAPAQEQCAVLAQPERPPPRVHTTFEPRDWWGDERFVA